MTPYTLEKSLPDTDKITLPEVGKFDACADGPMIPATFTLDKNLP
jgi:hypothetical protein